MKLLALNVKNIRKARRKGFTIAEVLVVIAILAILLAFGVPVAIGAIRNMHLTNLDDSARSIFMAAQNRMTAMVANGEFESFARDTTAPSRPSKATPMTYAGAYQAPSDFPHVNGDPSNPDPDAVTHGKPTDLYYLDSANPDHKPYLDALVGDGAIETEISEHHYVVEFNINTGAVYAVWYSDKEYTYDEADRGHAREPRDHAERLKEDTLVGYYGGSGVNRPEVDQMPIPAVSLINAEELRLDVTMPDLGTGTGALAPENVGVDVSVTGKVSGKTVTVLKDVYLGAAGGTATGSLILDSLKPLVSFPAPGTTYEWGAATSSGTVCGGPFHEWATDLLPGEDITVTVYVHYIGGDKLYLPQSVSVTGNSLFAQAEPVGSDLKTVTAEIAYGRHLQNLDHTTSGTVAGVVGGITVKKARQVREINFSTEKPAGAADSDKIYYWHSTYPGTAPLLWREFTPIRDRIDYDGQGLPIRHLTASAAGGLFGVVPDGTENVKLQNIVLIDGKSEHAGSGNSGMLAATLAGADITNCQVYLEEDTKSYEEATQKFPDVQMTGTGTGVQGGLVGSLTGGTNTIKNSFASTVIKSTGTGALGGLVGSLQSGADLEIQTSYAACYLDGAGIVGGLVGTGTTDLTIKNAYAAGVIYQAGTYAGGLVGNGQTATNGVSNAYAAVRYGEEVKKAITAGTLASVYGTAKGITDAQALNNNHVYYVRQPGIKYADDSGKHLTTKQLSQQTGTTVDPSTGIKYALGADWYSLPAEQGKDADKDGIPDGKSNPTYATFPYNHIEETSELATPYPYPQLKGVGPDGSTPAETQPMLHYGDWLEAEDNITLLYYEQYDGDGFDTTNTDITSKLVKVKDSTDNYFGIYGTVYTKPEDDEWGLESHLVQRDTTAATADDTDTSKRIYAKTDGYALYTTELLDGEVEFEVNGTPVAPDPGNPDEFTYDSSVTTQYLDITEVTDQNEYLYPLPKSVWDALITAATTGSGKGKYYQTLSVNGKVHLVNPLLACEAVSAIPGEELTEEQINKYNGLAADRYKKTKLAGIDAGGTTDSIIRTARQLAELGTVSNDSADTAAYRTGKYHQLLDIDYTLYSNANDGIEKGTAFNTGRVDKQAQTPIQLVGADANNTYYDGHSYVIRGLHAGVADGLKATQADGNDLAGLFGLVQKATLKDIRLVNTTVTVGADVGNDRSSAKVRVGTLAGYLYSATAENCGAYVETGNYVTITFNLDGTRDDEKLDNKYDTYNAAYTACTVDHSNGCNDYVGGLFGSVRGTTDDKSAVNKCFAAVKVAGTRRVGGFVGNTGCTTITDCYSGGHTGDNTTHDGVYKFEMANVTAAGSSSQFAGGFAGELSNDDTVTIQGTTYSTCSVSITTAAGGRAGQFIGRIEPMDLKWGSSKNDYTDTDGEKVTIVNWTNAGKKSDTTLYATGMVFIDGAPAAKVNDNKKTEANAKFNDESAYLCAYAPVKSGGTNSRAYDTKWAGTDSNRDTSDKKYPYQTAADQTFHHGDWPVQAYIAYFEAYSNGAKTTYGYYASWTDVDGAPHAINTLKTQQNLTDEKLTVTDDGYALISSSDLGVAIPWAGKNDGSGALQALTKTDSSKGYYIYNLPYEVVDITPTASSRYYRTMYANGIPLTYSPYFACEAINGEIKDLTDIQSKPGAAGAGSTDPDGKYDNKIVIRTPRHLANIARLTSKRNYSMVIDSEIAIENAKNDKDTAKVSKTNPTQTPARRGQYVQLLDLDFTTSGTHYTSAHINDGQNAGAGTTAANTLYPITLEGGSTKKAGYNGNKYAIKNLFLGKADGKEGDGEKNQHKTALFGYISKTDLEYITLENVIVKAATNTDVEDKTKASVYAGALVGFAYSKDANNLNAIKHIKLKDIDITVPSTLDLDNDKEIMTGALAAYMLNEATAAKDASGKDVFNSCDIDDITLEDITVTVEHAQSRYIGGMVGFIEGGDDANREEGFKVTNIKANAELTTAKPNNITVTVKASKQYAYVGGLFGRAKAITLDNSGVTDDLQLCGIDINVNSSKFFEGVGGLIGNVGKGKSNVTKMTIVDADIDVTAEEAYVGGMVGSNYTKNGDGSLTITECGIRASNAAKYETTKDAEGHDEPAGLDVKVSSDPNDHTSSSVGGFIGLAAHGKVTFKKDYAAIQVVADDTSSGNNTVALGVGGFAGRIDGGSIESCYAGGHTKNGSYRPDNTQPALRNVRAGGTKALAGGFVGSVDAKFTYTGYNYTTASVACENTSGVGKFAGNGTLDNGTTGNMLYAANAAYNYNGDTEVNGRSEPYLADAGDYLQKVETQRADATPYDIPTLPYTYPYKTTNGKDDTHYGDWYVKPETAGVFYYEYETDETPVSTASSYTETPHFKVYAFDNLTGADAAIKNPDKLPPLSTAKDGHAIAKWGYGTFTTGTDSFDIDVTSAADAGAGTEYTVNAGTTDPVLSAIRDAFGFDTAKVKLYEPISVGSAKVETADHTFLFKSNGTTAYRTYAINSAFAAAIQDVTGDTQTAPKTFTLGKTEKDAYQIRTIGQLDSIPDDLNGKGQYYFKQTHDLYNGADAYDDYLGAKGFGGTYDGQGYRILELDIANASERGIGLFGDVGMDYTNLVLKNIILYSPSGNASIKTTDIRHAGGLVGYINSGTVNISNCIVAGYTIETPRNSMGGLVGCIDNWGPNVTIQDSQASVRLKAKANSSDSDSNCIGGLVGQATGSNGDSRYKVKLQIINSYAGGKVEMPADSSSLSLGGLVGYVKNDPDEIESVSITNSYTTLQYTGNGTMPSTIYAIAPHMIPDYAASNNHYYASLLPAGVSINDGDYQGVTDTNKGTYASIPKNPDANDTYRPDGVDTRPSAMQANSRDKYPFKAVVKAVTNNDGTAAADTYLVHYGEWVVPHFQLSYFEAFDEANFEALDGAEGGKTDQAGKLVQLTGTGEDYHFAFYGLGEDNDGGVFTLNTLPSGYGFSAAADGYALLWPADLCPADKQPAETGLSWQLDGVAKTPALARAVNFDDDEDTITIDGKNYYVYILPTKVLDEEEPKTHPNVVTDDYSPDTSTVTVTDIAGAYAFNPYLAPTEHTADASDKLISDNDDVVIRTARQLNNLTRYQDGLASRSGLMYSRDFYQQLDIDFDAYAKETSATYGFKRTGSSIDAIGNATYDGDGDDTNYNYVKKAHVIRNMVTDYGLFQQIGETSNGATVRNVYLVNIQAHGGALTSKATTSTIINCGVYLDETGAKDSSGKYTILAEQDEDATPVPGKLNDGKVTKGIAGGLIGQADSCNILSSFAAVSVWGEDCAGGFIGVLSNADESGNTHTIENCFAGGRTVNGIYSSTHANVTAYDYQAGGFVGEVQNCEEIEFKGVCYTTCSVDMDDQDPGLFAGEVYASSGVVGPARLQKAAGTVLYALGEGVNNTDNDRYIRDESADGVITDPNEVLVENTADRVAAHPYDETLTSPYPYLPAGAAGSELEHYGDWPKIEYVKPMLAYYEAYSQAGTTGKTIAASDSFYYGFHTYYKDSSNTTTEFATLDYALTGDNKIVSDGYAILLPKDLNPTVPSVKYTVKYQNVEELGIETTAPDIDTWSRTAQPLVDASGNNVIVKIDGTEYCVYPMSPAVLDKMPRPYVLDDGSGNGKTLVSPDYYTTVTVGATELWFNPHFPYEALNTRPADVTKPSDKTVNASGTYSVALRTPRHLHNLTVYNRYITDISYKTSSDKALVPAAATWAIDQQADLDYEQSSTTHYRYLHLETGDDEFTVGTKENDPQGSIGMLLASDDGTSYGGSYTTNSHAIKNLFIKGQGLIAYARNIRLQDFELVNVAVEGFDPYVTAESSKRLYVGGLVGLLENNGSANGADTQNCGIYVSDAGSYSTYTVTNTPAFTNHFLPTSRQTATGGLIGKIIARDVSSEMENNFAAVQVTGTHNVGGLIGWSEGQNELTGANYSAGHTVNGKYASANVSGKSNVGGFIGYVAHGEEDERRVFSFGGTGKNNYTTCSVAGETNVGYFIGYAEMYAWSAGDDASAVDCYALGENLSTSATAQMIPANVQRNPTVDPDSTVAAEPYDKDTLGTTYPYPHSGWGSTLGSVHHGDWPGPKYVDPIVAYYEVYANAVAGQTVAATNGNYGFYVGNGTTATLNTLDLGLANNTIISDGYAILLPVAKNPDVKDDDDVVYSADQQTVKDLDVEGAAPAITTPEFNAQSLKNNTSRQTVKIDGENYYIYPMSPAVLDNMPRPYTLTGESMVERNYYTYVTVGGIKLWFNPHFAYEALNDKPGDVKQPTGGKTLNAAGSNTYTVAIRTPRQLHNLTVYNRWVTGSTNPAAASWIIDQQADLDYSTYQYRHAGSATFMAGKDKDHRQGSIGMLMNTYRTNGHIIKNLYIKGQGLFAYCGIRNVLQNFELVNISVDGADPYTVTNKRLYVGGLVGYAHDVDSVSNCGIYVTDDDPSDGIDPYDVFTIDNTGSGTRTQDATGGLIGCIFAPWDYSSWIGYNFAAVKVSGKDSVGGFIGHAEGQNELQGPNYSAGHTVDGKYVSANVIGEDKVGGFIGKVSNGIASMEPYHTYTFSMSDPNNYTTCSVSGTGNVSYFIGYIEDERDSVTGTEAAHLKGFEDFHEGCYALGTDFSPGTTQSTKARMYPSTVYGQSGVTLRATADAVPYDGTLGTSYPYPHPIGSNGWSPNDLGIVHHGDWPRPNIVSGIAYWERYSTGNYGLHIIGVTNTNKQIDLYNDLDTEHRTPTAKHEIAATGFAFFSNDTNKFNLTNLNIYLSGADGVTWQNEQHTYDSYVKAEIKAKTGIDNCVVYDTTTVTHAALNRGMTDVATLTVSGQMMYFLPGFADVSLESDYGKSAAHPMMVRTVNQLKNVSCGTKVFYYAQSHDIYGAGVTDYGTDRRSGEGEALPSGNLYYDGRSYQILDLGIGNSSTFFSSLFGHVDGNAELSNIILYATTEKTIRGHASGEPIHGNYIGGLVGDCDALTVNNCTVAGYTIQPDGLANDTMYVGGLAGQAKTASITNTEVVATIDCSSNSQGYCIGGLIGDVTTSGSVDTCYVGGTIKKPICGSDRAIVYAFAPMVSITNSYTYARMASTANDAVEGISFFVAGPAQTCTNVYYYDNINYIPATVEKGGASSISFTDLCNLTSIGGTAAHSYANGVSGTFTFRAVVRNASNEYVHYGWWPRYESDTAPAMLDEGVLIGPMTINESDEIASPESAGDIEDLLTQPVPAPSMDEPDYYAGQVDPNASDPDVPAAAAPDPAPDPGTEVPGESTTDPGTTTPDTPAPDPGTTDPAPAEPAPVDPAPAPEPVPEPAPAEPAPQESTEPPPTTDPVPEPAPETAPTPETQPAMPEGPGI